jgi:hypothetical protein
MYHRKRKTIEELEDVMNLLEIKKENNKKKIVWNLLCFINILVARADKISTLFMCKKLAHISGLCKSFYLLHVCM